MSSMNKLIKSLEKTIEDSSQKYYSNGSSELTDEEFDAVEAKLKQLNPESEALHRTSLGYDVYLDTTPGAKMPHLYGEVGSLIKCRCWTELPNRFRYTALKASLKLDGMSVALYYKDGYLQNAITRGDGHVGVDITEKVLYFSDVYELNDKGFTGCIRGEILMSNENFAKFKETNPNYKNARNSTAGLINSNEISENLKFLDIVVYNVIGCESDVWPKLYNTYDKLIQFLSRNFTFVVPNKSIQLDEVTLTEDMNILKDLWYDMWPADGIVLSSNDVIYNGITHEMSYDSIAFKFPAKEVCTTVKNVEWKMTKTRYAFPRINIEPVELAGTTVQYATAYNAKFIKDNYIGPGAEIIIRKSGEIIPQVMKVITKAEVPDIILECPICGETLQWNGVHLCCTNENCKNAEIQDLLVWINNIAPMDNFGDKLRLKFLEYYYHKENLSVECVMTNRKNIVASKVSGKQHEMFANMMNQLYDGKVTLKSALLALNIPRLGDITSEKLAAYPDVVERIIEASENDDPVSILDLNGYIGDANADSIRDNLHKFKRLRFLDNRILMNDVLSTSNKGNVAITGRLSVSRKQLEYELKSAGYKVVSSVNKNTDFLITDDPNSNSSKNIAADKFNVIKITEKEFRNKYM